MKCLSSNYLFNHFKNLLEALYSHKEIVSQIFWEEKRNEYCCVVREASAEEWRLHVTKVVECSSQVNGL